MTFLNRLLSRIKNERGAYMVFFAILIPIFFGCAGLAVYLGNGFARHARLQKAADAAVLAAAYVYDKDDVTDLKTVAHTYLEANLYADTAMRDNYKIDKITKRVYGDGTDETKGVLLSLYVSQNVDTTFMRILGLQKIPVSVEATARLVPDSPITGDPGVFGFTMVAGYSGPVENSWDLNKNAIYINSDNVYIHGKIHSNGPISIDHNNSGDKRSVFIEKGAFSSSAKTDLELWSNRRIVDWEHEDNTGPKDNGFTIMIQCYAHEIRQIGMTHLSIIRHQDIKILDRGLILIVLVMMMELVRDKTFWPRIHTWIRLILQ